MIEKDVDFSKLKTISTFDRGEASRMAVGFSQTESDISPSSLLVESLIQQICKLLEKDTQNQRKLYLAVCSKLHSMNLIGLSYRMEELQAMRANYQSALFNLLVVARSTTLEFPPTKPEDFYFPLSPSPTTRPALHISPLYSEFSKYTNEFLEISFIARGGFGNVYKAQHKLDGELYAIKKILLKLTSRNGLIDNLKEVKTLARMSHPNIVAYKAAWLEIIDELSVNDHLPYLSDSQSSSLSSPVVLKPVSQDGSLEVVFKNSNENETQSQSEKSKFSSNNESCSLVKNNYGMELCQHEENGKNSYAVIFIQMQLCHTTLRHWLDRRNKSSDVSIDALECASMVRQIASGVQYIHSQNVVHHDIKPSNIFVNADASQVQVGDFGLACSLLSHPPHQNHSKNHLGTRMYAAPEQLNGVCHPKSDVYSLGVVLIELVMPFTTAMERSKVVADIKAGEIPSAITGGLPTLAKIIKESLRPDLNERPSSKEILDILESKLTDNVEIIKEQQLVIKHLREENLEKDKQIEYLKEQLKKMMSNQATS